MKIAILGTGAGCAADAVVLSPLGEIWAEERTKQEIRSVALLSDIPEEIRTVAERIAAEMRSAEDEAKAAQDADLVILPRVDVAESEAESFSHKVVALAERNRKAWFVVRSKVPVGFTRHLREQGVRIICLPDLAFGDVRAALRPTHIVAGINRIDPQAADAAGRIAEALRIFKKDAPVQVMGEDEAETVMQFTDEYLCMQKKFWAELSEFAAANGADERVMQEGVRGVIEELLPDQKGRK